MVLHVAEHTYLQLEKKVDLYQILYINTAMNHIEV